MALVVILIVALSVGSYHPPRSTDATRIAYLDSVIKCPTCIDLTLAESSASTAVTLRRVVAKMVHEGQSDAAIERYAVGRYGPSILLDPKASGIDLVLYLGPLGAAVAVIGAAVVLFTVRSRRRRSGPSGREPPAAGDGGVSDEDLALVAAALGERT